ncbi:MAG TPA: type II toxin-antitoxin system HicB family antitoxin [Acidobacteriota bacterium]|nr:type II toxin-antitoxin system HicB family antitoxin [Acidobacteriota bacterium]
MDLIIECEVEEDGRWIAEISQLPGVLAYGATSEEASAKAEALALRVLAERLEHGEAKPVNITISVAV